MAHAASLFVEENSDKAHLLFSQQNGGGDERGVWGTVGEVG